MRKIIVRFTWPTTPASGQDVNEKAPYFVESKTDCVTFGGYGVPLPWGKTLKTPNRVLPAK